MDENQGNSDNRDRIHCDVCNAFVNCKSYYFHVQGKKHMKRASQLQNSVNNPKEPLVTGPLQFVFQELASLEIQFKSFLNQVLLSREECRITTSRILRDLEPSLGWEFGRCWPHIFGSMATGLALVGSDVDIYLDTGIYNHLLTSPNPKEELKRVVSRCARALKTDWRFAQVLPISMARVPIVKFLHQPTGVSCDISFKDSLGVHNSRLLQFYLSLNPRFFEVMVVVKFWAKQSGFCKCDGISSYGWTLLFISFLQTLKWPNGDPLIPSVNHLQRGYPPDPRSLINGWRVDFHPKQNFIILPNDPQLSHFGLLKGFFNYYKSFAFEKNIVCPYLGQPISRSSLVFEETGAFPPDCQWYQNQMITHLSSKVSPQHTISIQDPFQHDFLLGGSCSRKKYENILKGLETAAGVCQTEEELADPNASKFLTNLFSSRPLDHECTFKVKIREIPGVPAHALFDHAFVMLENIFTKVMKFEVKPQPGVLLHQRGEPDTKVVKKTETQDVHQPNDILTMEKKFYLAAVHPVWGHRKKLRREVKLSFPETSFEFETKLSDVIVNHNYPSDRIEFICDVQISKHLVMGMTLKGSGKQHKGIRNDVFLFLKNSLRVWMNVFLSEELAGAALTALPTSKPCSSKEGLVGAERDDSENGDTGRSCSESGTACEDSNSSLEVVDKKENGEVSLKESSGCTS